VKLTPSGPRLLQGAVLAAAFLSTGTAAVVAQNVPPSPQVTAAAATPAVRRVGYLPPGSAPDVMRVLPPPPVEGDTRDAADLAIFRTTRRFEGSARWALAQRDNTLGTPALLSAFSCAIDATITAEEAPVLSRLLSQSNVDSSAASVRAKDAFGRKRPYQREAGAVCLGQADIDRLTRTSSDYPSGHATAAWMAGRVLAEVVPDRSAEILERARTFGESRVVCGVHHVTAVEAGRLTAETVLAALHGVPAFRNDVEAARDEVSRLRASGKPKPATCTVDAAALAERPY
jgi:acid phosphatase (class A)